MAVLAMATGAIAGNVTETNLQTNVTNSFNTNRVTLAQTDFYCQELSDRVMHNVAKHSFLGFNWETNLTVTGEELKSRCKSASAKLEDIFGKPTAGDFQKAHNDREAQKEADAKQVNFAISCAQTQPNPKTSVDDFREAIVENYRNCMYIAGSNAISSPIGFHYLAEKCREVTDDLITVSNDFVEAQNYDPKK